MNILFFVWDRYWMGFLYLCNELQRRSEAFSTICQLDDISLLEEPNGKLSQMVFLLNIVYQCRS